MTKLRESERATLAQRSAAINRLSKLPPFHPTALQLLKVPVESDSAPADFELALQGDPPLASRLLKVLNAPPYGFRGRVDSVGHAIDLIGMEGIRSLAFTLALGSYLHGSESTAPGRSMWNHSLATAVLAETIGAAAGHDLPLLYIAGLLHDVGRLGLMKIEGRRYAGVLERRYFDLDESLVLESMLFGCSHDDAGTFLGRAWGIPQPVCECMGSHHQKEGNGSLHHIVQLACYMAAALGMGEVECENRPLPEEDECLAASVMHSANMKPERLLSQVQQITEAMENVGLHPAPGGGRWKTA